MKIQNASDHSLYTRNQEQTASERQEKVVKEDVKSIDASGLNLGQDSIAQRKDQAQKEAMDIIKSQFKSDGKIDKSLAECRTKIADSKGKAEEALDHINEITEQQEQLKEDWNIADDSQEQQNLELRLKAREAMKPGSKVEMSAEEWEQYSKLGPASEYEQAVLDWEKEKDMFRKDLEDANKDIAIQSQVIRGTKQEMLKHHGMDDAAGIAEEALAAASKEIVGMVVQEGMDSIKEEIDEAVEKGQELKEKNEEEEALREEKKADEMEFRQQAMNLPNAQKLQDEVEQKIQEIMAKQKLLEEDLKGCQVDQNV
ncbi:MAG: hypothetical protein HFI42_14445 [Lachnospiraceae bacterium]|nr:hypothetical protein [Lachnospiraceae bacterium]